MAEAEAEPELAAPRAVLDASALLAVLHDEAGASTVVEAIAAGAAVSVVNLAETLSKLAEVGKDPAGARAELREAEGDQSALRIEPLSEADCIEVARPRSLTRALGLSLADRACLALAKRLDVPALTADGSWADPEVHTEVRLIR